MTLQLDPKRDRALIAKIAQDTSVAPQAVHRRTERANAIPRAGRAPTTGLATFIKAGWNWTYATGLGYRLDKGALTTGWCESELEACRKGKELR